MNELCFTLVLLNLNKFLTIDFDKQKCMCTRQMCLDYSYLQERRSISKLYMVALECIDFLFTILEMNVLNSSFYKRKMFQPKYHWVEVKYLDVIQKRRQQLFLPM